MKRKSCVIGLTLLMLCLHGKALASLEDSTLTIITYHEAEIPSDLGQERVDNLIREYRDKLPRELQTAIRKIPSARDRIEFLERSPALIKLKKTVDYENVTALVDTILRVVSERPDAFLFTKIETGTGTIIFRAKIVNIKTVVKAEDRIEFAQTEAFVTETMNTQIQELAKNILLQVSPMNIQRIIEYKHIGLDAPRFLNYPTISSGVIALGSFAWYLVEDANVDDAYKKYNQPGSVEEITEARIEAEKALTRKNIAGTSAFISGVAFGFFILRDILWHKDKKVIKDEIGQSMGQNTGNPFKIGINHFPSKNGIFVEFTLRF